jgi:NAD(P) transhydrogenase subunit beta
MAEPALDLGRFRAKLRDTAVWAHLNADEATQIVFLKRSMRPGFAGIENELLFDPKTTLLFGDAKDTLGKLLSAVKNL